MFGGLKHACKYYFRMYRCHEQTYLTSKNKRNNPDRIELKKYCPRDHKVTLHRETK